MRALFKAMSLTHQKELIRSNERLTENRLPPFAVGPEPELENELIPDQPQSIYLKTLRRLTGMKNLYNFQSESGESESPEKSNSQSQRDSGEGPPAEEIESVPTTSESAAQTDPPVETTDVQVQTERRLPTSVSQAVQTTAPPPMSEVGVQAKEDVIEREENSSSKSLIDTMDILTEMSDDEWEERRGQKRIGSNDEERETKKPRQAVQKKVSNLQKIRSRSKRKVSVHPSQSKAQLDPEAEKLDNVTKPARKGSKRRAEKEAVTLGKPLQPLEKKSKAEEGEDGRTFLRCDTCGREFRQLFRLLRHVEREHPEKVQSPPASQPVDSKRVKCEVCGSTFATPSSLNRHRRRFHESQPLRRSSRNSKLRRFQPWTAV